MVSISFSDFFHDIFLAQTLRSRLQDQKQYAYGVFICSNGIDPSQTTQIAPAALERSANSGLTLNAWAGDGVCLSIEGNY